MFEVTGKFALYIVFGLAMLNALPLSPSGELKEFLIEYRPLISEFLAYANWFLPLSEMTSYFLVFLGTMATLQFLLMAGRIIGFFKE